MILMLMLVSVSGMRMKMTMRCAIIVGVSVLMFIGQMNIELHPVDARLLAARDVEMVTIKAKLFQFLLEPARIQAKVQ